MGCGSLVALALGAAGTGTQMYASSQERDAMNDATSQQLAQQQAFQKQGQQVFQDSLAQSTPQAAGQQQQQGAQQFATANKQASLAPLALPQTQQNDASNVSAAGQQAKNSLSSTANAQQQGYGNIGLQQYLKDLQAKSQLGVIGSQAQNSASVFPYVMQGAANSQANLAGIGSLLSSLGLLTGTASSAGMFGQAAPTIIPGPYNPGSWANPTGVIQGGGF